MEKAGRQQGFINRSIIIIAVVIILILILLIILIILFVADVAVVVVVCNHVIFSVNFIITPVIKVLLTTNA